MTTHETQNTPIAKASSLKDLTGWFGKWIRVPEGKEGILLYTDGTCKVFPSGKRPVIRPFERYSGHNLGMRIGYIPQGDFELGVGFEAIPCGDEQPVDASLLFKLHVLDPAVFFSKMVVPVGELTDFPDPEKEKLRGQVKKVTTQYEREDLLNKVPAERVNDEIGKQVAGSFSTLGLQLVDISWLFLRRSGNQVQAEQKLNELEVKLGESGQEVGKSVDQAEVNRVARQVFPDSINFGSGQSRPLSEVITTLKQVKQLDKRPRQHWLLGSIINGDVDSVDEKTLMTIKKWQRLEMNWIILLALIGTALTYLIFRFGMDLKNAQVMGFLIGIWGLIIPLILNSLKKLVDKKEAILFKKSGVANLESPRLVSHEDRVQVDQLVRQHCSKEVGHTKEVLNSSRATLYQAGNTDLALKIRDLEKRLEETQNKVSSGANGEPFYLTQAAITEADWQKLMDQEELVLKQAKTLGLMAGAFQSAIPEVSSEDLHKIEQQMLAFQESVFNRTRIN